MSRNVFRGDRLKQRRERVGLTQADLMTALKLNPRQIAHYEAGFSLPLIPTL